MTGAQSDNLTEKTKAMYKVAGAADEAFKQQTNNIEDLTAKVNNLWSNALTQLGMVVLPIVKVALEVTVPILQILAEHMDALIPIISAVVAGFSSFSIIQSVVGLFELLKLSTIAQTICNGGLSASLQAVYNCLESNQFSRWVKGDNGKILQGLVKRRNMEKELFLKDSCKKVKVTATVLNIRAGAGVNYKIVGYLPKNSIVSLSVTSNGFGKLSDGRGWISLNYVDYQ